jgi:acyl-CoA synthetase (AMP-forming)/AMP-acid ligase II
MQDRTLVDLLVQRASSQPDQLAYTFIGEGERRPDSLGFSLTYRELFEQAAGLAALLQAHGLAGERVLLVFRSNTSFVIAFFGCLLAGAVAVPTAPPRRERMMHRLSAIASNAGAKAGLADSDDVMQAAAGLRHDDLHWFQVRELGQDDGLRARAAEWRSPALCAESLAFLQYTSGSTGDPKGVMVSHGNLMANSLEIAQGLVLDASTRMLISLPLYHDMGLIGGILQPLYGAFPVFLMSPAQFVQKPQLWLELISELRISCSGGPNFMYQLASQAVPTESLASIDLSCLRTAFCGAEPIRTTTVSAFNRRFGSCGFDERAFYPCYGMAEATLFITGNPHWSVPVADVGVDGGRPVMGCGRTHPQTRVEIVAPETAVALPDGQEGEIWVKGPSVAQGYWHNPQATDKTFKAHVRGSNDGPFLRTGDLGFRKDGQLYVTGRLKDLIILRGRNFAPQDLEIEAEACHPALQPASGAAFTLTDGDRERLIVAFELKREWRHREEEWSVVRTAVRSAIARNFDIRVDDVVLLAPGSLPRTSSGKVRRSQCRTDYLKGTLTTMTPGARRSRAQAMEVPR